MRSRVAIVLIAVAAMVATAGAAPATAADPGPPPSSMASIGDSITRGFNACGFFFDCTSRSFSTGSTGSVNSQYLRIRAVNPAINGRNFNHGETGARADDMPAQAQSVVNRGGVQYVTMLIGANDACTSSEATMTPPTTFRAHIDTALATLKAANMRVEVISIPNVNRLWEVGRTSGSARNTWSLFGICQSLLANPTSTAQPDVDRRARVHQRVVDFNAQLAAACAAYGPACAFDGNAVFGFPFQLSHVSTWDYFHPNTSGQAVLASISYAAGFGW